VETNVPSMRLTDAVHRLRGMFMDVPGSRLSPDDAARLSGVDTPLCQAVLEALLAARFLKRGRDGTFTRTSD